MKTAIKKVLLLVLLCGCVWGIGGICFAENATQVVLQVSYPSGKEYACFYNGTASAIDLTKKEYYVNVHVTLLDEHNNPATAGTNGEALSAVTATLTTELGIANSIVEDQFLSDSTDLTFDLHDGGPAARAHVKYACTSNCDPGTDTIEITVDSLSDTAEVKVKAPPANDLVVRTPRVKGSGPTDLFDSISAQSNNGSLPASAGDSIYFEVWTREGINNEFTFAPELDGRTVTVSAYADYNANNTIGDALQEDTAVATKTAAFHDGKATGYITIEKAGNQDSAGNAQLKVVLTARATDLEGNVVQTAQVSDDPVSTTTTLDWVGMQPNTKNKLIIGNDPLGNTGNLIQEVDTWYVLDDNSKGPTSTNLTVFVADEYGNPVTGELVQVKAGITGPIADAAKSLVDADGQLPTTSRAGTAWDISYTGKGKTAGLATVQSDFGNNQQEATGGGATNRGKPLEATFTLEDEGLNLSADTATVYLVRWDNDAPQSLDLHLDTDKPATEVTAGTTVTLYITSASGSSGNPTTSEIVEYDDPLVIKATNCGGSTDYLISSSTQDYAQATSAGLVLKAPSPNPSTKHIEVPIKLWGTCSQDAVDSVCFTLTDSSKGIEDVPLYSSASRSIADLKPAGETKVKISALPTGVAAQNGNLDAAPIVITSDMRVGANGLLTPASVDTVDAYNNIYNDTPSYGISSDVGTATVDVTRGATITFEDDDVGQTATVTVSVTDVGTKQLKINTIKECAGALECALEGPALPPPPGGEAIIQLAAHKTFTPTPRTVRISIDQAYSEDDAELRDFNGEAYDNATTNQSLASGSMVRLVVSAPSEGTVRIKASDISGSSSLLDTATCTVIFEAYLSAPSAEISPADGDTVLPTSEIVITVTDNAAVNLTSTSYSVVKDGSDITSSLECITSGDETIQGTITCGKSGGGLDEGSYTVTVTPKDMAGHTGDTVSSTFTVSTPVVTISPEGAAVANCNNTLQFTATTAWNGTDVTSSAVYSWEISVQCSMGSAIDQTGLYTSGSTACTEEITVTDTVHGNASDTATVTVCTPEVSISPATAEVNYGETLQFTAETTCDGTTVIGTYSWESPGNCGIIDSTGLYAAGSTVCTEEVTVTDTANCTTTATTTVTVKPRVEVTTLPDPMLRSRWILLPAFMTIAGEGTSFAVFSSTVTFDPAASVLPLIPLILDAQTIWELIFVMPSWLAGGAESETLTVTVTTGSEVVDDDVAIEILPFLLDKNKSLK